MIKLKQHVNDRGGKPEESAGFWNAFAQAVLMGSQVAGDAVTLKALKKGEEMVATLGGAIMDHAEVDTEIKMLMRDDFLPRQRRHVQQLEQAMAS